MKIIPMFMGISLCTTKVKISLKLINLKSFIWMNNNKQLQVINKKFS